MVIISLSHLSFLKILSFEISYTHV